MEEAAKPAGHHRRSSARREPHLPPHQSRQPHSAGCKHITGFVGPRKVDLGSAVGEAPKAPHIVAHYADLRHLPIWTLQVARRSVGETPSVSDRELDHDEHRRRTPLRLEARGNQVRPAGTAPPGANPEIHPGGIWTLNSDGREPSPSITRAYEVSMRRARTQHGVTLACMSRFREERGGKQRHSPYRTACRWNQPPDGYQRKPTSLMRRTATGASARSSHFAGS